MCVTGIEANTGHNERHLIVVTITEGVAARDKSLYGLAVSVVLREDETPEKDFYEIKDALLKWQHLRGAGCGALSIEYQVVESQRSEVEDFWKAKFFEDRSIRPLLECIGKIELSLITPAGRNIRKVGFEFG